MKKLKPNHLLIIGLLLGILTGYYSNSVLMSLAEVIADAIMNLLRLISVPIIFLSILATITGMESLSEMRGIGGKVLKYTLLTTVTAALVAMVFFIVLDPVGLSSVSQEGGIVQSTATESQDFSFLQQFIPDNFVKVFLENNVIAALFIAIALSIATLGLPEENKHTLHKFFASLFAAVLKITSWIAALMPLAVWAFVAIFVQELQSSCNSLERLMLYLCCVVGANLVQGFIVLPLFLRWKKVKVARHAKGVFPALAFAFFAKSSSATLPIAMECAENQLGISKRVSRFSLPLCITINMNACAAFIFTTVIFVSMSEGASYSIAHMLVWVVVASIAAIGNAAVPMGCFFLSSAFLAAMGTPLELLGVILPFYAFIDMLETALNVWSDTCITAVVDREEAASTVLG